MEINKNHFVLDKYHLETEACQQPSLYQYYGELAADKQKEVDKKSLQLEQLEAQTKIEIRASGGKITQDQVDCLISTDANVQKMRNELIDLKHERDVLKTAVSAMEQKRSMIEMEVKIQNNRVFQESGNIGERSSAEWVEAALEKQLKGVNQ